VSGRAGFAKVGLLALAVLFAAGCQQQALIVQTPACMKPDSKVIKPLPPPVAAPAVADAVAKLKIRVVRLPRAGEVAAQEPPKTGAVRGTGEGT